MSVADYTEVLIRAGMPAKLAAAVAEADAGVARGEWFTASEDLVKLIGKPATTVHEAIRNAAATILTPSRLLPDAVSPRDRQALWE